VKNMVICRSQLSRQGGNRLPHTHSQLSSWRATGQLSRLASPLDLSQLIRTQVAIYQNPGYVVLVRRLLKTGTVVVLVTSFSFLGAEKGSWLLKNEIIKYTVVRLVEPVIFCAAPALPVPVALSTSPKLYRYKIFKSVFIS
jgi:hypothetical protein